MTEKQSEPLNNQLPWKKFGFKFFNYEIIKHYAKHANKNGKPNKDEDDDWEEKSA
jgi:hypothetical protein